jgi:hypothetical protein
MFLQHQPYKMLFVVASLQKFYPELLWPTKERKARKKYRNKEKVGRVMRFQPPHAALAVPLERQGSTVCGALPAPIAERFTIAKLVPDLFLCGAVPQTPRQRFKVSQDGKGGRSANS